MSRPTMSSRTDARRVALDDVGRPARHAEGAVDRRLGLADHIGDGGGHDRGDLSPGVLWQPHETGPYQVVLVRHPRRVMHDPSLVAPQRS